MSDEPRTELLELTQTLPSEDERNLDEEEGVNEALMSAWVRIPEDTTSTGLLLPVPEVQNGRMSSPMVQLTPDETLRYPSNSESPHVD
jgi:hypothetical protein